MANKLQAPRQKRLCMGRMTDASKQLRLQSHETGPDCRCARYKCFETVSEENRRRIIREFNLLPTAYDQTLYLTALFEAKEIKRRRFRKEITEKSILHQNAYTYKVRVLREGRLEDVRVCYQAFISIHGISGSHLQRLKDAIRNTGMPFVDRRGRHKNRTNRVPKSTLLAALRHIEGYLEQEHLSKPKYKKGEFPCIRKMHNLYSEQYTNHPISYEYYRQLYKVRREERATAGSLTCGSKRISSETPSAEISSRSKKPSTRTLSLDMMLEEDNEPDVKVEVLEGYEAEDVTELLLPDQIAFEETGDLENIKQEFLSEFESSENSDKTDEVVDKSEQSENEMSLLDGISTTNLDQIKLITKPKENKLHGTATSNQLSDLKNQHKLTSSDVCYEGDALLRGAGSPNSLPVRNPHLDSQDSPRSPGNTGCSRGESEILVSLKNVPLAWRRDTADKIMELVELVAEQRVQPSSIVFSLL